MKTITINIPDTIELNKEEFVMIVATRLYEQGKLSLGQAAEFAGMSKNTFAEVLGNYNVSLFNYPASDVIRDADNA